MLCFSQFILQVPADQYRIDEKILEEGFAYPVVNIREEGEEVLIPVAFLAVQYGSNFVPPRFVGAPCVHAVHQLEQFGKIFLWIVVQVA